jgi:hypothetical protein
MNAMPATDKAPISALVWRCVREAWKPRQRGGKLAAVGKHNDNANPQSPPHRQRLQQT